VKEFIAAKDKAGRQGTRTYGAKLKPLSEKFSGRELHTIHADEWDAYLEKFTDGVTRNDFRKRAVALCRWAYKRKRMPQGAPLEVEQTERSAENPSEIGIQISTCSRRSYWQASAASAQTKCMASVATLKSASSGRTCI
jgi:hypothetical protein